MHPAACVLVDGRLVAFAEEERFARVKQACGLFPARAMGACLRQAGLSLRDVDALGFGWDANVNWFRMPLTMARSFVASRLSQAGRASWRRRLLAAPSMGSGALSGLQSLLHLHPWTLQERLILALREAGFVRDPIPPIRFFQHHLCHAATAFYASGFQEAAVLIFDGHGEEHTVSIYHGEGRSLRAVRHVGLPHSLGWFYSAATEYLGWDANEGEVKLMGLAPYGRPDPSVRAAVEEFLAVDAGRRADRPGRDLLRPAQLRPLLRGQDRRPARTAARPRRAAHPSAPRHRLRRAAAPGRGRAAPGTTGAARDGQPEPVRGRRRGAELQDDRDAAPRPRCRPAVRAAACRTTRARHWERPCSPAKRPETTAAS